LLVKRIDLQKGGVANVFGAANLQRASSFPFRSRFSERVLSQENEPTVKRKKNEYEALKICSEAFVQITMI
jgi:hypothetical protein